MAPQPAPTATTNAAGAGAITASKTPALVEADPPSKVATDSGDKAGAVLTSDEAVAVSRPADRPASTTSTRRALRSSGPSREHVDDEKQRASTTAAPAALPAAAAACVNAPTGGGKGGGGSAGLDGGDAGAAAASMVVEGEHVGTSIGGHGGGRVKRGRAAVEAEVVEGGAGGRDEMEEGREAENGDKVGEGRAVKRSRGVGESWRLL